MYHSITFIRTIPGEEEDSYDIRNTWDDFHLIPSSRPVFQPPEIMTQFVDVPGRNGDIDLTDVLSGGPTSGSSESTLEFIVDNREASYGDWPERYSELLNYMHGQRLIAILEDDPAHYYGGRFLVKNWVSGKSYATVEITATVNEFMREIEDVSQPDTHSG